MTTFDDEIPIREIGPYRLEERLGRGGMGDVYRAFDARLERRVALKQIRPDTTANPGARQRFRREARAAARLNHPNIVKVHDLLETGDGDWIVMELVEGETLSRLLEAGPLAFEKAASVAVELALALSAAHAEGIVHRDLKAKNVIITPAGSAKILDFGLAKQIVGRGAEPSLTATGQMIGTPQSMSPEQVMGQKVGMRSDLFSLGVLLYEMATGVSPFRGANVIETLRNVCTRHQVPACEQAPGVPRELSELIDRLLEKEPCHRPADAGEVVSALRRLSRSSRERRFGDRVPRVGADEQNTIQAAETVALQTSEGLQTTSERRQVTAMSCELVGVDEVSASSISSVSYQWLAEFETAVREAVEPYEGRVASSQGHRLLIYFGYPIAHEDSAIRAVRAARDLVSGFAAPPASDGRRRDARPGVCVGVHTGPALVLPSPSGETDRGEQSLAFERLALGPTLDQVREIERRAEPGTILVSDATRRLVADAFAVEALPRESHSPTPVAAFRIVGEQDMSVRGKASEAFVPLVAREREMGLLLERWRDAREGKSQTVLLSGEAGIGKSRLVRSLAAELESEDHRWLEAQGSVYAQGSPFHPLLGPLRRLLELSSEAGSGDQLARLALKLQELGIDGSAVPIVADLLALPWAADDPPSPLSPEVRRQRTLELLVELILETARREPLVVVVEDVHWLDPSTLAFLDELIARSARARLLLLLTFRLEFEAPWGQRAQLSQVHLDRLAASEALALVERFTGGKALPEEIRNEILARTDGVPLFVEELTKTLLESGALLEQEDRYVLTGPLQELVIPTTLQDSLMARLDRLGEAKTVAQIASVIGREFSGELLAAVAPIDRQELGWSLDRLVDAGLVHRKGFSSRRRYVFKHALVQDAAYDSLLKSRRRELHREIGIVLEELFPKIAEREPELLAHHFEKSGSWPRAIELLQIAGHRSADRAAHIEAVRHQGKAIDLLGRLPESRDRDRRELDLQMAFANSLMPAKGYAAVEVEKAFLRAQELVDELDEPSRQFSISWGFWAYSLTRGRRERTLELAYRLLQIARLTRIRGQSRAAHFAVGQTVFWKGDFEKAIRSFDEALKERPKDGGDPEVDLVEDPVRLAHVYRAWTLWFCGCPESAVRRLDEITAAEGDFFSQAVLLAFQGALAQAVRDRERALSASGRLIRIAREHEYPLYLAIGKTLHGWARAQLGSVEEGIEEICDGLEIYRGTGQLTPYTQHLYYLADTYLLAEDAAKGLEVVEEALALSKRNLDGLFEAALLHLRGELMLLAPPDPKAAESQFRRALEVADEQKADSLALRAALSLARLLQTRGEVPEAKRLLGAVYARFAEGFDGEDLEAARQLLEQLSRSTS